MEELERANELGCWFSVSPTMLSGRKGKSLVSKMPFSRILPETDAPFTEKRGIPYMPWEAFEIIDTLKDIFCLDTEQIKNELISNAKRFIDWRQ
jgi:TatD DNase family protein